jgi:hypothetical protein
MVFHIEPVTYVFPVSIDRKGFFLKGIKDDKGYQFFRKLVWAVIVAAI